MVLGTNLCSHCNEVVEDELQVLRDCPLAMSIWIGLVKPSMRSNFFGGDLSCWVRFNLTHQRHGLDGLSWASIWVTDCHYLWTWRNKGKHDPSFIRPLWPWSVVYHYKKVAIYLRKLPTTPNLSLTNEFLTDIFVTNPFLVFKPFPASFPTDSASVGIYRQKIRSLSLKFRR